MVNQQYYNNLDEALSDLGWFHIDNIQTENSVAIKHLQKIFDPTKSDENNNPLIITDKKTIIICDNHDFNETYLIDVVSKLLKEQNYKKGDLELVLIDNVCCRSYIQNPKFIPYYDESDYKTIEKEKLVPSVFVINPNTKCIVCQQENILGPIIEENIKYILQYLDDEKSKELMQE